MARHVADIKRGQKSIEEKADAIGSFVTSFLLEIRTARDVAADLPCYAKKKVSVPLRSAPSKEESASAPAFLEETAASPDLPAAVPAVLVIRINPPITVKQLAAKLGIQPNQLIAELMSLNIFANINQTIEPDIASKICENHGFVLERERREKGAAVRKVEPILMASSPRVMEKAAITTSLEEIMHKLHTDTVLFLHTADTLAAALREYDLDWSPAVIMLCKAFEKETNVRLLAPLREKTSGRDLKGDISDEDLGRIARFCSAAGQPPELGTLGHFLNTAIHSKQRRASSILLQSFYELVSDWPRSQWLVDEFGLSAALKKLTREFRNPAAHIEKLSESDFGNCRNFVREAPEIVMLKLFLATSR
jgi:hypothetical protein